MDWGIELEGPVLEWCLSIKLNKLKHICVKQSRGHRANNFPEEHHGTNGVSDCLRSQERKAAFLIGSLNG